MDNFFKPYFVHFVKMIVFVSVMHSSIQMISVNNCLNALQCFIPQCSLCREARIHL